MFIVTEYAALTTLFRMSIFKDLLALQNQACFHGNQHVVILTHVKY